MIIPLKRKSCTALDFHGIFHFLFVWKVDKLQKASNRFTKPSNRLNELVFLYFL